MERLDDAVAGREHTGATLFILISEEVMGAQLWRTLPSSGCVCMFLPEWFI